MKSHPRSTNSYLALFPANLLKDQRWRRQMATYTSLQGYLLVAPLNNPKQTRFMLQLKRALQRQGVMVSVLRF